MAAVFFWNFWHVGVGVGEGGRGDWEGGGGKCCLSQANIPGQAVLPPTQSTLKGQSHHTE